MKSLTLALALLCRIALADTTLNLRVEGESVDFRSASGQTISLRVAKLFYKDPDGITVPANETYIIEVIDGAYPKIIDVIEGHSVKFQLADVDEKKGDEVLVYYFSGGNQYGVNIYTVQGIDVKPLKAQPRSSNMRSVRLSGKEIIVRNEQRSAEGVRFISTEVYRVVGGDCKLVREGNGRGEQ